MVADKTKRPRSRQTLGDQRCPVYRIRKRAGPFKQWISSTPVAPLRACVSIPPDATYNKTCNSLGERTRRMIAGSGEERSVAKLKRLRPSEMAVIIADRLRVLVRGTKVGWSRNPMPLVSLSEASSGELRAYQKTLAVVLILRALFG